MTPGDTETSVFVLGEFSCHKIVFAGVSLTPAAPLRCIGQDEACYCYVCVGCLFFLFCVSESSATLENNARPNSVILRISLTDRPVLSVVKDCNVHMTCVTPTLRPCYSRHPPIVLTALIRDRPALTTRINVTVVGTAALACLLARTGCVNVSLAYSDKH